MSDLPEREIQAELDSLQVELQQLKQDLAAKPTRTFIGYEGDPDDLLDPQYKQKDLSLRTRDCYAWLAENFRRVVRDTDDSTTIDFSHAQSKPPTPLAVQLLEEYARTEPGSPERRKLLDLIGKFTTAAKPATKPKAASQKPKPSGIRYAGET